MNKNRESTSSSSDDGYNSDNQSKQAQKYNIARDTALFKKNYQVVELLNNSANGQDIANKFIRTEAGRFQCLNCTENYARVENVRSHINQKHSEVIEKYKCPLCEAILSQKSNIYTHCRRMHNEVYNTIDFSKVEVITTPNPDFRATNSLGVNDTTNNVSNSFVNGLNNSTSNSMRRLSME